MIEIEDTGIILSAYQFQEKFLILKCFSENNGIISGLVRINKKKNEYIIGNLAFLNWKARLHDQLGYFKIEVLHCPFSEIMFDKDRVAILNSLVSMLILILKDREVNKAIFHELQNLLQVICNSELLSEVYKCYINFEKKLLDCSGYELDWNRCAVTKSTANLKYVSPKTGNAVTEEVGKKYHDKLLKLPGFMIGSENNISSDDILEGLKLIGYFFEKFILIPNAINFPKSRYNLVHSLYNQISKS